MMEKAEAIRCRRFEQLLNEQFGFLDKEKLRIDFLEYFRKKRVRGLVPIKFGPISGFGLYLPG